MIFSCNERRGWDSNPRALADKRFSRPPRYDHFDTSPCIHFCAASLATRCILAQGFTFCQHFFWNFFKYFYFAFHFYFFLSHKPPGIPKNKAFLHFIYARILSRYPDLLVLSILYWYNFLQIILPEVSSSSLLPLHRPWHKRHPFSLNGHMLL